MSWIVAALCALQAPVDTVEPQDPDRPAYSSADLKALREANVFSPHRKSGSSSSGRRDERRSEPRTEPAPARPKPLQVTGFVLDPVTKTPRAIVEDRNDEKLRTLKEPLFAKPGDEAAGWTFEEVTSEQVTIVQGETKKVLRVGESFPEPAGAAAPTSVAETTTDKPAEVKPPPVDDAAKNDILERLKQKNKKKRTDEP
ncbi:MAG TPA: hypothetical protein VF950_07900 [Planctomycetota bacterium]